MAKRLTDCSKWNKPFLRTMKAPYKLLWIYILDECDHAGIWQVDFDVARIKIGEQLNQEEALNLFEGKIFQFDNNEKWFIPDFIDFQYGVLQADNRVHNSVIKILSKYKLEEFKGLNTPLQGCKDKDKDKDKVKDKYKDSEQSSKFRTTISGKHYTTSPTDTMKQLAAIRFDTTLLNNLRGMNHKEVIEKFDFEFPIYEFEDINHIFNKFISFAKAPVKPKPIKDFNPNSAIPLMR